MKDIDFAEDSIIRRSEQQWNGMAWYSVYGLQVRQPSKKLIMTPTPTPFIYCKMKIHYYFNFEKFFLTNITNTNDYPSYPFQVPNCINNPSAPPKSSLVPIQPAGSAAATTTTMTFGFI
nr:hypothetical protein Iba_chr03cCG7020 [Ipomoea batatas]